MGQEGPGINDKEKGDEYLAYYDWSLPALTGMQKNRKQTQLCEPLPPHPGNQTTKGTSIPPPSHTHTHTHTPLTDKVSQGGDSKGAALKVKR